MKVPLILSYHPHHHEKRETRNELQTYQILCEDLGLWHGSSLSSLPPPSTSNKISLLDIQAALNLSFTHPLLSFSYLHHNDRNLYNNIYFILFYFFLKKKKKERISSLIQRNLSVEIISLLKYTTDSPDQF